MIKKYLQDIVASTLKSILGGHTYTGWASKNLVLHTNIPIKNTLLAKELEAACKKNGFLTYSEFLTIEQFGTYGYHNTHDQHGMTDVKFRWPEALAILAQKKRLHHLVEFGPGDGIVGVKTLKEAKKLHFPLSWSGVEIHKGLQEKARKLFRKEGFEKQLMQLVPTLDTLTLKEPCLFLFSYSLDNLVPEVFINTHQEKHMPSAMVGITVKNGLLSEVLLSEKELTKLGCKLKNDIYKDAEGFSWDLSSWQLNYMQRMYVSLEAYQTLFATSQLLPKDSHILIIDEFRIDEHPSTYHLGIPRDLETFSRDFSDFDKLYRTAGENLLYFPMFRATTVSFLSQLGFSLEENIGEHKLSNMLSGRNNSLPLNPHTFALLTRKKEKNTKRKTFVL